MKKRIYAIVCVLIWLILIAPVLTPYIKTLFIHDAMAIDQVVSIMGNTTDIGSGTVVLQWDMPFGQQFGVSFWPSEGRVFVVGNQYWLSPNNLPWWIVPVAVGCIVTALTMGIYLLLRKRLLSKIVK